MNKGAYFYTDRFLRYDLGAQHPLKPTRLARTHELLMCYGALADVDVRDPNPCPLDDLGSAHSAEYIETVDRLSTGEHVPFPFRYGFGYGDNPVFPDMWDASLLYTGASLDAAQAILDGSRVAMNISGGLHHAHWDRAAGFCVFNDCVVAIRRLRKRFARVAYVDIDVHHGDGVQEAFYDDPSVLTVSLHESGQTLFPGFGFVREVGIGEGTGFSVNLPMWPYTDDETWYWAWREAAWPILNAFAPEAVCIECGTDPHYLDPLARVCLTAQGWLRAVEDVMGMGLPTLILGGGGYNPTTVPRMWALAFGVAFGVELPNETPADYPYRDRIPTLRDDEDPPIAPHDLVQAQAHARQTVAEVKELLFGHHGL
ncbi:MAG: acetoin utilization protein AcuC [Armatimonadetes bacterium]|nr:acetoin utilization protein AcuC [Armatimonadota bacterium]